MRLGICGFVLALAACGGGKGYVLVTVDADGPLLVDRLAVSAMNAGASATYDVPAPMAPRDLQANPMTFSLETSPSRSGAIQISVEGFLAVTSIGSAMATGDIQPGSVTAVRVTLRGAALGDMQTPDLANPADLSGGAVCRFDVNNFDDSCAFGP